MNRRAAVLLIAVLTATGALTACSDDESDPATSPAAPTSARPSTRTPGTGPGRTPEAPAGPGSTAGRAPAGDLAIRSRRLDFRRGADRPLPTTVWYPTDGAGPYPLVLFSHGLTSEPSAYADLLRSWAEAGFVVAAPAYPHTSYRVRDFNPLDVINQPADASEVITRMLALNTRAGDPLRGRINTARVAAAGHSAGGITTVGMFSGERDERLAAGIVLAGRQVLATPFTGPAAPMLFVHGKLDRTVAHADGLAAFNAVPWPKAMLTVTEGGHVAITKDFAPVIATTRDFLRYSLYGDRAARGRLASDAERGGRDTLIDRL